MLLCFQRIYTQSNRANPVSVLKQDYYCFGKQILKLYRLQWTVYIQQKNFCGHACQIYPYYIEKSALLQSMGLRTRSGWRIGAHDGVINIGQCRGNCHHRQNQEILKKVSQLKTRNIK